MRAHKNSNQNAIGGYVDILPVLQCLEGVAYNF